MADRRAPFETEATVCGHQGSARHLRAHLAITPDEVGEDREHHATRGTLETPDGDPAQTDPDRMRVARQAPADATGRLVRALHPEGQDERQHQCEKRLAVAKELKGGSFRAENRR
jgi:hypothetical protein